MWPLIMMCTLLLYLTNLPLPVATRFLLSPNYGNIYGTALELPQLATDNGQEHTMSEVLAFALVDEPSKSWAADDFFHDVRRLVVGIYKFVEHPSNTLYNALIYNESSKKQQNKKQKQPLTHKLQLDSYGNLAVTFGFAFNFQASHNIGFSRMNSLVQRK